jgi:single-strand DNA-binding protein
MSINRKEAPMPRTSSPNVNTITLVGNLTADPVLRQLPDGRSVCDLRLAVNDQKDQPPLYIDIATFGKAADACAKYLTKGRQVAVTGRLTPQEWEAKDGSKRSKHQVVGRVSFGGRSDDDAQEADGDDAAV